MGPCFALIVQLILVAATQHSAAEPIQSELLSDLPDNVTTTDFKGTKEESVTYDPSFDGEGSLFHHFTSEEIEMNRWISIDRSGVEYTATDAEVIRNLERALKLQQKHYSAVLDAHFSPQQNATVNKRAVFPPDDRYASSSRCNIGYLNSGCTAFLIGPYHALTAGHCVYDCKNRWWRNGNTQLDLYVGQNCYTRGRRMRWTRAWTYTSQCSGVRDLFNNGYDIAWIKFETSDRSSCWHGFGWLSPNPTLSIELCGYPSDKKRTYKCLYCSHCNDCRYRRESYTTTTKTGFLGWKRKTVTRYRNNDKEWQYTCDTIGGHSGSPVIASRSGYTFAVGVHSKENTNLNLNFGSRITAARFTTIREWLCDNGYCPSTVNL